MHLNLKPRNHLISKVRPNHPGGIFVYLFFLVCLPTLLVIGMEFLERGSFHDTIHWVLSYKPLFLLNAQVAAKVPGLLSNLVVDSDQGLHAKTPDSANTLIKDYQNVQYDLLFGKQYLASHIDHDYLTKTAQASYNAEFAAQDASQTAKETSSTSAAKPVSTQ